MATPTRRRSTRFQPIVSPRKAVESNLTTKFTWANPDEPLFTRPLNPEWDLHDEDRDKFDEEEEGRRSELTTKFYGELRVASTKKAGKGKKATKPKEQAMTFSMGDTVLVSSDSSQPSIGVIVDMWEIDLREENEEGEERIRVRVHWFDRPSDLPSIRAKRCYHEVHTSFLPFYSYNLSTILERDLLHSLPINSSLPEHYNLSLRRQEWHGIRYASSNPVSSWG